MTISRGKCNGCERDDIEVYDQNGLCIICTRLDAQDGLLSKLYDTVLTMSKALKEIDRLIGDSNGTRN